MNKRIIYYYQTFVGLKDILTPDTKVTHLHLSSIHFGLDNNNNPYIHLNNNLPNSKVFDSVWSELETAKQLGIKVILMVGGAGGAFQDLFSNFETYYSLLKELVLEKAKEWYNKETISKLDKIIQPHYLGIDKINNVEVPTKKKTIIFNHRDNYYTGWTWFIDRMDELYKQRQDFTVYTTLADLDRPYAKRVKISDRDEYLDFIRSMQVGVGTFQKYSAWSISTTDSLSMGVPYILPNKLCYPEMVGGDYPLLYDGKDEFLQKINGALDDDGSVDKAKAYLKTKIEEFPWANRVPNWFGSWNFLTPDSFDMIGEKSEAYPKIVDFIHKRKSVTKKEILDYLGWGVRISFSPYRNRLRTESTIKFTKNRYEVR